jgi:hypothetical protein
LFDPGWGDIGKNNYLYQHVTLYGIKLTLLTKRH